MIQKEHLLLLRFFHILNDIHLHYEFSIHILIPFIEINLSSIQRNILIYLWKLYVTEIKYHILFDRKYKTQFK